MILDCYVLARHYHVSPMVFLEMTFSEIQMHMHRTAQVVRQQRDEQEDD